MKSYPFVIVGGGISGVCCAKEILRIQSDVECGHQVLLITASSVVSESSVILKHTEFLEEISVYEQAAEKFQLSNPSLDIVHDVAVTLDPIQHLLFLQSGESIRYGKICICTGVRPKLIANHQSIIGIRDLESVEALVKRLKDAKRIAIIGNGGIALELIHELKSCHIDWIIKDNYIGSAFFDSTASAFILPILQEQQILPQTTHIISTQSRKSDKEADLPLKGKTDRQGYGLGPEWIHKTNFRQSTSNLSSSYSLHIHYEQEVIALREITRKEWIVVNEMIMSTIPLPTEEELQLFIQQNHLTDDTNLLLIFTTSRQIIACDFIISATGVTPNTEFLRQNSKSDSSEIIDCDQEGYIIVNDYFQSVSHPDIYAAGDCCCYQPQFRSQEFFFQMKLWTQARIMGMFTAQCMLDVAEDYGIDSQLELFSHITRFFGYKVVLLGRYNAQGLGSLIENTVKTSTVTISGEEVKFGEHKASSPRTQEKDESTKSGHKRIRDEMTSHGHHSSLELWVRINPTKEYIKLVVKDGKVIGCLLIGETGLEEVFENLILNRLNIESIGIQLLDPTLDIADYFD